MAGMAGFEPTHTRVKVWCLTAWRHPNMKGFPNPDTQNTIAQFSRFCNNYFEILLPECRAVLTYPKKRGMISHSRRCGGTGRHKGLKILYSVPHYVLKNLLIL